MLPHLSINSPVISSANKKNNQTTSTEEKNLIENAEPLYLKPSFGPNRILDKLHPEILELIIYFVILSKNNLFNFQLVNKFFLAATEKYLEKLFKTRDAEKNEIYKNGREIRLFLTTALKTVKSEKYNSLNFLLNNIFLGNILRGRPYRALELILLESENHDIRKKLEYLDKIEIFFSNHQTEDELSYSAKSLIKLQDHKDISPEQISFISDQSIYYLIQKSDPQLKFFLDIPPSALITSFNVSGTEIIEACARNDIELVRLMIKSNMFSPIGMDMVHWAVEHRNLEFLELFINEKVNLDKRDVYGHTPLFACLTKREKQADDFVIMSMLIKGGANIHTADSSQNTALTLASKLGFFDITKLLIQYGAEKNHQNYFLNTPAHLAAQYGHTEIILYFWADPEIDFEAKNQLGDSVFHSAAKWGQRSVINILSNQKDNTNSSEQGTAIQSINRTIDIDAKNKYKLSPLNSVASSYRPDMLKLLLTLNADKESQDEKGWRPLHHAANAGNIDSIDALIEAQVCIDAKAHDGKTPLMLAASIGNVATVKKLMPHSQFDPVTNLEDRATLIELKKTYKLKSEIINTLLKNNDQSTLASLGIDISCLVL